MPLRVSKGEIMPTLFWDIETRSGEPLDPTLLRTTLSYKAYQALVRPVEDLLANRAPGLLAFQNVIVARKPPRPRKLSLTVGMLTMDEEESVANMIAEIKRVAPDAKILCVPAGDPRWSHVQTMDDLPEHLAEEIEHFFEVYKMIEPGKHSTTRGWEGADAAIAEIAACRARATAG